MAFNAEHVLEKVCSRCGVAKPVRDFSPVSRERPDRRDGRCRPCKNEALREYRAKNPEKHRESNRRSREKREPKRREEKLRYRYNFSLEEYEEMFRRQEGRCAVCLHEIYFQSTRHTKTRYRANVDHCHESGKVRGLLCTPCNVLLGHAEDRVEVLLAAVSYLEASS